MLVLGFMCAGSIIENWRLRTIEEQMRYLEAETINTKNAASEILRIAWKTDKEKEELNKVTYRKGSAHRGHETMEEVKPCELAKYADGLTITCPPGTTGITMSDWSSIFKGPIILTIHSDGNIEWELAPQSLWDYIAIRQQYKNSTTGETEPALRGK